MLIIPNSKIILLKSPLKLDNYNQITFTNATAQYNYFYGLTKLELTNATYQRKDEALYFPTHIKEGDNLPVFEDLLEYNYCMYQNTSYSSKWFYAFITDIKYDNNGMSVITLETDVFQSWQFNINYMNSFIEREHVSDDTIGVHTIPEGLETGEYIVNASGAVSTNLDTTPLICIGTSYLPDNTPFMTNNRMYGGVFSGMYYVLFKFTESAAKFVQAFSDIGHADDIRSVFMIPLVIANVSYTDGWSTGSLGNQTNINFKVLPNTTAITGTSDFVIQVANEVSITSPTTLNGYTPKNNKLYCYPYNCLSITNNVGTQAEFRYEDFTSNNPKFNIVAVPSPSCAGWLFPVNYKLDTTAKSGYNWGLSIGKYPQGSCNSDMYTNWLTQNGLNIFGLRIDAGTSQALGGSLQALVGAGTQDIEGIGGGLGKMLGAIQTQYKASMIPNQIHGQTNTGDITFAYNKMSPTYYKMSIRYEYAKMIDDFFTMYGYKVNRLATPNIHKRSNWDYIKCIDANLEGAIPENDLNKIRKLFNNGCTFWHTTQYFLDYSRTNSILT